MSSVLLQVFCRALLGTPLKDSEFLKLEQTHLADVIAEEQGNEHFRAGNAEVSNCHHCTGSVDL